MRHVIVLSGSGWHLWRDTEAEWQHDTLHLPPVNLAELPARPPSGGWAALAELGDEVEVPGTVEQHCWNEIGDYRGVSWWWRRFTIPSDATGERFVLQFDAVRLRAEVFLDEALVGYDLIGNTPFEVDITGHVTPGSEHLLAVRVTDPGGNFSWEDFDADTWGKYTLPASHGFGGVTGDVRLVATPAVHVEDVAIKNKPNPTAIDIDVRLCNHEDAPDSQDVRIEIFNHRDEQDRVLDQTFAAVALSPGEHKLALSANVGGAKLWSPETPHLYVCRVTLSNGDRHDTRFGFRWFSVEAYQGQSIFRLNGRRIVLRTAISWSFWPTNGIFPTRELAERQIRTAKACGLNMLSFHRAIGHPLVLDLADELGLLYYEEPGGYTAHGGDEFCFAWAREKLLRMVKRDRNHPALVIYNMINEEESEPTERHRRDMRDAHRLDPTRCITFTSGWNSPGEDPKKLHMLPNTERQYTSGWTDFHHAPGPGVYRDEFYNGPQDYRLHTDNRSEIVFWGEEGAIGTPPRLEMIAQQITNKPDGWDGADYRAWYQAYVDYLDRKQLRPYFPSVDVLTESLGDIAYYYQGRMIENVRLGNLTDGYAVNGWESMPHENHSGIVDCFRNPKGHPRLLAYYNQPLYVAVKLRNKLCARPLQVTADFFIINEQDVRGEHTLTAWLEDPAGNQYWLQDYPVSVSGGETYGELLTERVRITAAVSEGLYMLRAQLRDKQGVVKAVGHDELYVVDWRNMHLPTNGATLGGDAELDAFLEREKYLSLPRLGRSTPELSYIIAAGFDPIPREVIASKYFATPDGQRGLQGQYFRGCNFEEPLTTRIDAVPHVSATADGSDSKFVPGTDTGKQDFSVRWTGRLHVPESGPYYFHADSDDGLRLWIDGELVIDEWTDYAWWHGKRPVLLHSGPVTLSGGRDYEIKIEFFQQAGQGVFKLYWTTPGSKSATDGTVDRVVERVRRDGTTALVLDNTCAWATVLAERGVLRYRGRMHGKCNWLGSNYFVRQHPLFKGLPVNQALNWPYQEFAEYKADRHALLLEDEEAVVGFVSDHQQQVGTAVGVAPCGKGRFVLSTLEILPRLSSERTPCEMVRKVLCNFVTYAGNASVRDS